MADRRRGEVRLKPDPAKTDRDVRLKPDATKTVDATNIVDATNTVDATRTPDATKPDPPRLFSEVVEAEEHLIDSQILNVVFDTVVKNNASFDVLRFDIGRSNDQPSSIAMRISAPSQQTLTQVLEELVALGCRLADQQDALVREADRDGCVPDDFYSTTNHRSYVRLNGQWIE